MRWLRGRSVLFGFDYVFTRHIEFISFDVKSVMFSEEKLFARSSDVNTDRMVEEASQCCVRTATLCGIFLYDVKLFVELVCWKRIRVFTGNVKRVCFSLQCV